MINTVPELLLAFILYSFFGWCLEVIVVYVKTKKFVNRGFLFSPLCPIYGFALLSIIAVYNSAPDNLISLFLSAVLLTALFELFTGFILERVFNKKWWDYSNEPLNVGGYICLWVSIVWGALSVIVVRVIHPVAINRIEGLSITAMSVISYTLVFFIIFDLILTITSLVFVKKRMVILTDVRGSINKLADDINKANIVNAAKIQSDIEKLKKRYQNILSKKIIGNDRFASAFPKLDLIKTLRRPRNKK